MKKTYGTSGFRYPVAVMQSMAYYIGQGICLLSHQHHKVIGIMITASHNPHTDNGVKLVQHDGSMISQEDERFMETCIKDPPKELLITRNTIIVIGMDTRPSSEDLKDLILLGIQSVDKFPTIINLGWTTTPQLHHETYCQANNIHKPYLDTYFALVPDLEYPHVVVDCANGVGTFSMRQLVETHRLQNNVILRNTNISDSKSLNNYCGSDYVCNHLDRDFFLMNDVLHASLDGDADRIVCYLRDKQDIMLLDGDYISALFAYYIYKFVYLLGMHVGVVHTAYANTRFLSFIHSMGFETQCTATGVKHLHHAAQQYDIGIYFESNGHGTVLFKEEIDCDLKQWISPFIGDGIADLFAILFVLQKIDITPKQWYQLYSKEPSKTYKLYVNDKSIFHTTSDETRLIAPEKVQNDLDEIMKNGCRIFIRPSGTENIVRLHIEGPTIGDIERSKELVKDTMQEFI